MRRQVTRVVALLALLLPLATTPRAVNPHGTPDTQGEMQARFVDGFMPYIHSGCLPVVPRSSLTFPAFACTGYVRMAPSGLVYVSQAANALTLPTTTGLYWLALHRDASSPVSGWTRQAGSSYLFQQASTQPADPTGGLVFARVTVASSVIVAILPVACTDILCGRTDGQQLWNLRTHAYTACDNATDD